jgi:hypothetical protein
MMRAIMGLKDKKKEIITAIAMLIFSLVYLYGSLSLHVGTARNPGAGFLPVLIGLSLLVSSCLYLYQAIRQPRAVLEEAEPVGKLNLWVPTGIAVVIFGYPLLLRHMYFIPSTALGLFVLFRLMRFKGWIVSLSAAVVISVLIFLLFSWLGVILPNGAVEQFFFRLRS